MASRNTRRSGRRRPKVTTSFGPLEIPSTSGPVIDLTADSPSNDLLPTQLGGSSSSRSRTRRIRSVVLYENSFDLKDTIDICTPTKEEEHDIKRSQETSPEPFPQKKLALEPIVPGCPICLEKLEFCDPPPEKRVVTTQCGHLYCNSCILPILKENSACPKCRRKQTPKDLIPLYPSFPI